MVSNFTATHKTWDHVGNLVPNWEHCEGIRPDIQGAPAPWLPVQYYDKHFEEWITVMAGKIVAFTRDEFIVPAGLRVAWAANIAADPTGNSTLITYTANDVSNLVIDITTGSAVTAAVPYTYNQVMNGLKSRGLLETGEVASNYISRPAGVAAHCMYAWAFNTQDMNAADHELSNFGIDAKFYNHFMQHEVTILCDYALRLPWVPRQVTATAIPAVLTVPANPQAIVGSNTLMSSTNIKTAARYSGLAGSNFLAYAAAETPVAKNTPRSAISSTVSGLFTRLRTSPDALTAVGDYYIDYDSGVFFFFVSGGAAIPAGWAGGTLSYFAYEATPASVSNYICVVGQAHAGDFLECDVNSNFVVATSTDFRDIMGQRLTSVQHPRDYLDRVRTAYTGQGTLDAVPGTASGGYPDNITYSSAADTEVIVNLISR